MTGCFKLAVITTSRADYGIYGSLLTALEGDPRIELELIVGGAHLSIDYGMTIDMIERDGYSIAARVPCVPRDDSDRAIALTMAKALSGFSEALASLRPDLVIVLGDRYEMHSAALAALPLRIPVAHIHGGEETEGAFDNSLRHSLTKLSHIHLCSTELAAKRIRAMGENSDHVHVVGALALDSIYENELMSRIEWGKKFNVPKGAFILLTFHPVTLSPENTISDFNIILDALNDCGKLLVISLSNADTSGLGLNSYLAQLAINRKDVCLVNNMGSHGYYSAMHHADFMIGNSSSGIIEAASFGLPVINIGNRQKGREISPNTIHAKLQIDIIQRAIERIDDLNFRRLCERKYNVYSQDCSAQKIVNALHSFFESDGSILKPFYLS